MPGNVFISYYPFDTLDVVSKLDEQEKMRELGEKLGYAARNMTWSASQMRLSDPLGFFAVPEYYFLKKYKMEGRNLQVELYSEKERDALLGKLIMLSDQYNHTVILPGSITWRRPLARPVRATRMGKQVDLAFEGISSVPVCYAGNLLASYDKVMNDSTIDGHMDDTRFAPGTASPLFTVGNLKCGIEICGDFNEKNLAKATGAQSLDFEFMMSATNYHRFQDDMDGIPVRNGGYFLHVDQAPAKAKFYNGVWCVERGKGSYGRNLSDGYMAFDPWTAKPLKKDLLGMELSAGHAVAITTEINGTQTSGMKLPGQTAFAGLKLSQLSCQVTGPMDTRTGRFEVTLAVMLSQTGGSTSPKANRTIHFSSKGATVRPSTALTDGAGNASAVFTCNKDQTAKLTASFHGAKVVVAVSIVWLGAGDITKISALKGVPHPEVPTFFTPIA